MFILPIYFNSVCTPELGIICYLCMRMWLGNFGVEEFDPGSGASGGLWVGSWDNCQQLPEDLLPKEFGKRPEPGAGRTFRIESAELRGLVRYGGRACARGNRL